MDRYVELLGKTFDVMESSARNKMIEKLLGEYNKLDNKEYNTREDRHKNHEKIMELKETMYKYASHNLIDSAIDKMRKGETDPSKAMDKARKAWSVNSKPTFGDGPLHQVQTRETKGKENFTKDFGGPSKVHNESVNDIKLIIYESCHSGDITEEERDTLLEML